MALDDLDLEFEDEEEAKKKKNDVVQQDVDLEFHMQDNDVKARPARPLASQPAQGARPPQAQAQIRKIEDARGPQGPARRPPNAGHPQGRGNTSPGMRLPQSVGGNALNAQPVIDGHFELEAQEVVELRERVRKAEHDADVKVQVAEFKLEIMSELLGDMKLMDHQINQLLVRINAKHPDLKQEALMIKKILADFTAKKRK